MEVFATIRISPELHARIKALAEAEVRTISGEMEIIVTYYEQHVKQPVASGGKQ